MSPERTVDNALAPLAVLPEDWSTALAIVAHPDDMEYGAAAAVAKWSAAGKSIHYLLASRGEAGIDSLPPAEAATLRAREQRAACDAVGVTSLRFLDHPDGAIHDVMRLRREFATAIRMHQPEVVITINHRDSFGPGSWNMADHRVVGTAVIDAVRDAANRWVFTDAVGDDNEILQPWQGVRFTAIAGSPEVTHAVDVTGHVEAGVASLKAHEAYLRGLGPAGADPDALGRGFVTRLSPRFAGVPCAGFEVLGLPAS